ncbi:MAG TPA: ShET2/EspL2 family type III secretion system effector toxin [Trinickia sp.]|uniref:ShET2/EspL2 family type III secretion system effector toxin n=1 Tax=Trinickia sp. TaxID=2571163 RepID=UPI002C4379B5|nr:ShET2/EspL2 family type III secretion system effector toxin [Trinickia sp.]HVW50430.1 ShET2/EspL2 family type III secretion system effector toxin [Trinickia sp.]
MQAVTGPANLSRFCVNSMTSGGGRQEQTPWSSPLQDAKSGFTVTLAPLHIVSDALYIDRAADLNDETASLSARCFRAIAPSEEAALDTFRPFPPYLGHGKARARSDFDMPLRPISAAHPANASSGSDYGKPEADASEAIRPLDSRSAQGGFMENLRQLGRSPVAKAVSNGMQWLRGRSLDLRGHDPETILDSAPRGRRFLAKVETVRLPEGTTTVPHWMQELPKLKNVDASGFAGEKLALRAPKLAKVKVPPATLVENRANTNKKTLVKHVDAGRTVGTSTATGQVYLSKAKAGRSDSLNGEVSFAGRRGELIWCRHITLREILDAQRIDSEKAHAISTGPARRADVRHALMGTRSRMKRHIDASIEARYHEIKQCSTENYLLSHDRWGEFITDKFAQMPKPGRVALLLETNKHAMAMFLSAKHAKGRPLGANSMEYSVRCFDPNSMSEHVRVKETDYKKFATLGVKDFIGDVETREYYYAADREFRTGGPVTCVAEIPRDAFAKRAHEPLYAPGSTRSVDLYLADEDVSQAVVRKHLKGMGMPAHAALVDATKARPRDQRAAYLQSMRPAFGHFEFEDAVNELERGGDLNSGNARQLLEDLEGSAANVR